MLAAILFCGLVMTSCSDQQVIIDNPVTPEPEQASAKDPGKWWIDENNMDKSVKHVVEEHGRRSDIQYHYAPQRDEAHLQRESEQPDRR